MTWGLKIGVVCACLLFIYIQARYQSKMFKEQKHISHFSKALFYSLIVALLTVVMMWGKWHDWKDENRMWEIPLLGSLCRLAWFDPVMSFFRRVPFFYNGATNVSALYNKGSWVDRLENKLSTDTVVALKIFYIAGWLAALIFL